MDSPRSEAIQTRFSTPVSELDDHRLQPSSLPRADSTANPSGFGAPRNSKMRTSSGHSRSAVNQQTLNVNDALLQAATTTRDFEEAVIDDKSTRGPVRENPAVIMPGTMEQGNPGRSRRPTIVFPNGEEQPIRSRAVSTSSRTTSPPNSVEAFAGHRRRERAGTVNSKAPSDLETGLQRTISGDTHRRRPTFSDGKGINQVDLDKVSCQQELAEEDVCFPPPEEFSKTYIIDFEALEEFVAESSKKPATQNRISRTHSLSSQSKLPRIFQDLRYEAHQIIPKIIATHETSSTPDVSSEEILDEKKTDSDANGGDAIELDHCFSARQGNSTDTNRFSFFSSELESTIHAPELGDLIIPGETFRDLFELGPDGGVWWLDMLNPNMDEVNAICKAFSIHPLTCEDIKTQEAREKVELFKQYYFVCFRSFFQMDKKSEDYMEPVNVYVIVFREGVLSFTFCQSPHASNVRKRIGRLRDYVSLSSDWICYAMIDDIVDQFGPVIHDIELESDMIEDQVFVSHADDFASLLRQIGECRKKVMGLMRLLGGKADVIKGFSKRCNDQYSVTPRSDIGLYLGDIQDHVVTMVSTLGHAEKMLSRSHSNYLAQLSVDNLVQGNRANEVLSKITLIATIVVPLNLICGMFGMNVPVPGKDSESLGWFFGIFGAICAITLGCLLIAKKFRFI